MTTTPNDPEMRELVKASLAKIKELTAQLTAAEKARSEPIAIVGIGCRFPGGADSPSAFWELLCEGRDAVGPLDERWALVGARPSENVPRWAGLLTEPVDRFDAAFFGISPREAVSLDPQHRLLLEVAWEALEEANILPGSLEGGHIGVFVGNMSAHYTSIVEQQPRDTWDAYSATGNFLSILCGRLSYTLGLQGPCLTVDTGCSSSLVAIHLAVRSLRSRESDLALAGGVGVMLSPAQFEIFSHTRSLSPDGRCKTFDALANGFARGEGCGVVALKRLSDARRDGDRIWALIRGSAMNQDGRSTGLTAPNVLAQEALLRRALQDARVEPGDIGFVETHGTGTSLGDPIEVEALRAVVGAPRPDGSRCVLGAVKTNVGHLEAAAGVASLIKAALALHHERIPQNLHLETPNPRLRLDGTALALATEPVPWPRGRRRRFAGVSAFGLGGTNAHAVLEEAPASEPAAAAPERSAELVVLSARSEAALEAAAARLRQHLDVHPELGLGDVAFRLATARSAMEHRLAVAASSREALRDALSAAQTSSGAGRGRAEAGSRPKVVFVFPGQGGQWLGMGRQLMAEEPVFRAALEACDRAILAEAGWSPLAELAAGEDASQLGRIDVVQPLLFAVEVALAALWRSWGVEPDLVVGHSMGEVAAAHVAGILSLSDAVKVICRRSKLLRKVSGQGAMALVELSLGEAEVALAGHEDRLSVAVSNAPRSTVISGDPAALEEALAKLEERGVFCRRVKVDVASHSPQMEPLLDELRSLLREVQPQAARIAMRSTVTGAKVEGAELAAAYWCRNLRQPVLFSGAIQELAGAGPTLFLELSPHPILLPAVEENLRERGQDGAAIASLRRGEAERRSMLEGLGQAWARGAVVNWKALHPAGGRAVALPAYPWQRERYWLDATAPAARRRSAPGAGEHPLLGAPFESALHPEERLWEQQAIHEVVPWLAEHRLRGEAIFPGGAYLEMALAAGAATFGAGRFELGELRFERMLALPAATLQIAVAREARAATAVIASRAEGAAEWTRHASAELREAAAALARAEVPSQIQERCPDIVEPAEHYGRLEQAGVEYGPRLRTVQRLWVGDGEALGQVRLAPELSGEVRQYQAHPALLDGCFQVAVALLLSRTAGRTLVPVVCSRVRVGERLPEQIAGDPSAGMDAWVHARGDAQGVELTVLDADGQVLLELGGIRLAPLGGASDPLDDCVYGLAWRRRELVSRASAPAPRAPLGEWLVLRDAGGTGAALARALRAAGESCVEIDAAELSELPRRLPAACRGVVHCGSLDAAPWEETSLATLEADLRRGSLAAVTLAQAVVRRALRDSPRLFLVTRGAQAVAGGPVSPAQAPLWGLARVIALEHPELECTRIDLPFLPRTDEAERLAAELLRSDGEEQVALRPEGRFVARLVRSSLDASAPASTAPPVEIRADGSYLITGGLGGLGLSLARWMVEQGGRHLALTGRSAPSGAALAAIRAMEEAGAEVRVIRGDVSRPDDVERIMGEIRERMPALRGVVHAAVVVNDRTLLELGEEQFSATMGPKMLGAWNLHQATRELPLDFFAMYSSVASLLGEPGQGAYAAGNAFLDALSHARQAEGLSATSLQWGLFADVGVAAAGDRTQRLSSRGLESLTIEEGNELFRRAIARPRPEVGLLRLSLQRWLESTPQAAGMRYLSELPRERAVEPSAGAATFREALARAPLAERAGLLETHVIEQIGQVLRLAPSRIDPRAPLMSLGLDSLTSLEARNRLEKSLGLRLQATLFFTYPRVSSLAEHLLERLDLPSPAAAPVATVEATAAAERVEPALERAESEPLAIVGMACRFPGGGDGAEAYFQMLERGVDAVREIPAERWPKGAILGANPGVRWASLLDQVDGFDAAFFGISPREAESLDPQQRLLLEMAWEALEDAGQRSDALGGAPVGVFAGFSSLDYQHRLLQRGADHVDAYVTTGNLLSTAAGRVSYTFDFQGPCLSVDTACSSSLVAVTLACQSLRAGDCDMALAGGVNVLLSPFMMAMVAGTQALAPDGRCKTLDAQANGFVRGEGCGIVVLKRLSDAQRDGDRIRAVIRGFSVNQDGRSSGLTAPNVLSQQALLRHALERAAVSPDEVGYVEMHGTGTSLGDPIETDALREVLGRSRSDGSTCVLGAVKTNIGHLEGAAGVAGLIKAVLALEHEAIPRNLHFRTLNPRISLDGTPFVIPTETVPWKRNGKRRVAGVSSFGISGTNAHVVLEEAPPAAPQLEAPERSAEPSAFFAFALSAKSAAALDAAAGRLREHLDAHPSLGLGDVAFSLATTRSHLEHRLAVAAASREELREALEAAAEGQTPPGAVRGSSAPSRGKVAFLFTGQGAQAPGMGRGLYEAWPAFREAFDRCAVLFDRELAKPLRGVMWAPRGSAEAALLDETAYTQPALFTLEYALHELWRSWGVEADLLAGHSVGELAAACVAGVLSLADAVRLVAARGRLMQALPAGGAMVSIAAAEQEVLAALAPHAAAVSIAAVNEPGQVVIAGAEEAVEAIAAGFSARGARTKRLRVSHAFHSPLIEPMLEAFRRVAEAVTYRAPDRPVVSNVTGRVAGAEMATADYWVRHVRETVRFSDGVKALHEAGAGVFVEVGPTATLLGLVPLCLPDAAPRLLPSLRAGRPEAASALEALGGLWTAGGAVRWASVFPAGSARVPLPTYAWQRERHWIDAPSGDAQGARGRAHTGGHPLLGEAETLSTQAGVRLWQTTLELTRLPWLGDHRIQGTVVFPGAGYLEMALSSGAEVLGEGPLEVTGAELMQALAFADDEVVPVQVVTTMDEPGRLRFQVASLAAGADRSAWQVHCRGAVRRAPRAEAPARVDLGALRARLEASVPGATASAELRAMGLEYGPAFQGLIELWRGDGEALGRVRLPEAAGPAAAYRLHPALLDACLQVIIGASLRGGDTTPWVPVEVGSLRLLKRPAGELWCHAQRANDGPERSDRKSSDFLVVDGSGAVVAELSGLVVQRLAGPAPRREEDDWFLELAWEPAAVGAPKLRAGRWLLLGDGAGLGAALGAALEAAGHAVAQAPAGDASAASVRALLAEAFGGQAPTAVVHLGSLEGSGPLDAGALEAALVRGCDSALATVQALSANRDAPRLWLVTRGAQAAGAGDVAVQQAPLLGLGRVIAVEHAELRCARVDLDPARPEGEAAALLAELLADGSEDEVAFRSGERRVARLGRAPEAARRERIEPAGERPFRLEIDKPGGLDDLVLRAAARRAPDPGEVEIEIEAAGLNFLDVRMALGEMPDDVPGAPDGRMALGVECAGRVVALGEGVSGIEVGQPVIALARGAFASHVTTNATLVLPRPAGLSAPEAAAAFRKMAEARHVGKIVLALKEPEAPIVVRAEETGAAIRGDGSYLVTGGLGGLGLRVAGWLLQQGAGHVVLMGRSGAASPEQQAAVAALEAQGARVTVAKADVADRAQVEQALREISASGMPLRGVVHAAGLLDDGLLLQQTPARFRAVMAPKALGALHLHLLTRSMPLDFFVLYASGAGLLGTPGQGNYAAANTFLDALAQHRRREGLPGLSVDWGAFSEVGMAAAQESRGARLSSRGMRSLTPEEGLAALARLLGGDRAQVGVLPLDARRWVESYPALSSSRLLSRLLSEEPAPEGRSAKHGALLERLAAATPGERARLMEAFLRAQVAQVIRMPEGKLDVSTPLTSLGMDSLMGLELCNRLEAQLVCRVSVATLWRHPTIAALTDLLLEGILRAEVKLEPLPSLPIPQGSPTEELEEGTL